MRTKWTVILSLVTLSIMIVLAGCGNKEATAEELLSRALEASQNLKSYEFTSEVDLTIEFPESVRQADPVAAMAAGFLSDISITASGAYQEEPLKTETTMDLKLGGDVGMTIRVPIILEEEKMWIKMPNIPMLAGFIPSEAVGKYIEFDFNELEELNAEADVALSPAAINVETQKQLGLDVMRVLLKHFDEEEYVQILKKDEVTLPEGVQASNVLRISLTQEQLQQAATVFVEDALPELIDVLAKPEYAALLGDTFDAEEAKSELAENQAEVKEALEELKDTLVIQELSMLLAMDKEGNMPYSDMTFHLTVSEDGEQMRFQGKVTSTMTNINGEPPFELEKPTTDNTLTLKQLGELFGAGLSF